MRLFRYFFPHKTRGCPAGGDERLGPCVVIAFLLTLLSPTLVWSQNNKDFIKQAGVAGLVSGSITDVSPDSITIVNGGETKRVPVEEITRLNLLDEPAGLGSVRNSVQSGQLEQASKQLQSLQVPASSRAIVKQEVAYFRALVKARLALRGTGEVSDAVRGLVDFLKKNPRSFRYYAACEMVGDLAMSLARYDTAAAYYARIQHAQSDSLKNRSRMLQGNAWMEKGETEKAGQLFELVSTAEDDRLRALGLVGLARCRAEGGQSAEGIKMIEKVIVENDVADTELFAQAYNALGRCYDVDGKSEDALLAYLHTDLLFNRETTAHAEAVYHLSKLWSSVNKPDQAAKYRQLLKQRYATTAWAKK